MKKHLPEIPNYNSLQDQADLTPVAQESHDHYIDLPAEQVMNIVSVGLATVDGREHDFQLSIFDDPNEGEQFVDKVELLGAEAGAYVPTGNEVAIRLVTEQRESPRDLRYSFASVREAEAFFNLVLDSRKPALH